MLVQNPKSKTKQDNRILCESPAYAGKVIEKEGIQYKVQYNANEAATITSWFPVNHITSITKSVENKREKQIATSMKMKQRNGKDNHFPKNEGMTAAPIL